MKRLFLMSLVLLCSCSSKTIQPVNELDYSIIREEDFVKWNDIFEMEESSYKVYFYSEHCGYCKQIKQDILSYYLINMERLYFCNSDENEVVMKANDEALIGVCSIEDFFIPGTPYLVGFNNNVVSEIYKGSKQIKEYIANH